MKPATLGTFILLDLIATIHLVRILLRVEVTVGGTAMPMWASVAGLIIAGGLAIGLWREHAPRRP